MSTFSTLIASIGKPLASFLLRRYLKEPTSEIGEELLDIASRKLDEVADRREAQRQFESLSDKVINSLLPLFEHEAASTQVSVAAVANELGRTLNGQITAKFFLEHSLEPAELTNALRATRPLRDGLLSEVETELYERSLAAVVRQIVELSADLPQFDATFASLQLRKISTLQNDMSRVIETTSRIEQLLISAGRQDDSARFEADYRAALIRELDYLQLVGVDLAPESRRHRLSVAYITLSLQTNRDPDTGPRPVQAIMNSLSESSGRLLIRGEAGSGKSTLFRWAAIAAASADRDDDDFTGLIRDVEESVDRSDLPTVSSPITSAPSNLGRDEFPVDASLDETSAATWREKIPFVIWLRECRHGKLPPIEALPTLIATKIRAAPPGWVPSILAAGRGLVLIDGIDEVPHVRRTTVFDEIRSLITTYPRSYYLLSTRPSAVQEGWLKPLNFREATIAPMSSTDRDHFIDKWHAAAAHELTVVGKPSGELLDLADSLKAEIRQNPPIARLATNPLLAAMICALHRDRGQRIPENQYELTEALCHMLLDRRERESGLDLSEFPRGYRLLTYPQKRSIVQDLAEHMLLEGVSVIELAAAQQQVALSLRSIRGRSQADATTVVRGLIERSGMLREERPGAVDFVHNTFKEFLAAARFVEKNRVKFLSERAADPAWEQVLMFSAASPERRDFAAKLINAIFPPTPARGEKRSGRGRPRKMTKAELTEHLRRVTAVRLGAVSQHLDPDNQRRLATVARQLFPPRSMREAEALAVTGDAAVPFLRRRHMTGDRAAACIRALRLIGTQAANSALGEYLGDSRQGVVAELIQAVNPLDIAYVRNSIQGGFVPRHWRQRITDLSPLALVPECRRLDLSSTRIVDESLDAISRLDRLEFLQLQNTGITDAGLQYLAGLTSLTHLWLHRTRIGDPGLASLVRLVGLRTLILNATAVTDVGITHLSGLAKLSVLYLSGLDVTDSGVANLSGFDELTVLHLGNTKITDTSMEYIGRMTGLRRLNVRGTAITDAGVQCISNIADFEEVDLSETQIGDCATVHLAAARGLKKLSLGETMITDYGLSWLSGLIGLRELFLPRTNITDKGLEHLSTLGELERLDLSETSISDAGLACLYDCSRLRVVDLKGTRISAEERAKLGKHLGSRSSSAASAG